MNVYSMAESLLSITDMAVHSLQGYSSSSTPRLTDPSIHDNVLFDVTTRNLNTNHPGIVHLKADMNSPTISPGEVSDLQFDTSTPYTPSTRSDDSPTVESYNSSTASAILIRNTIVPFTPSDKTKASDINTRIDKTKTDNRIEKECKAIENQNTKEKYNKQRDKHNINKPTTNYKAKDQKVTNSFSIKLSKHEGSNTYTAPGQSLQEKRSPTEREDGVKRVKVKSKYLREIKSPFEDETHDQSTEQHVPPALVKKNKESRNNTNDRRIVQPGVLESNNLHSPSSDNQSLSSIEQQRGSTDDLELSRQRGSTESSDLRHTPISQMSFLRQSKSDIGVSVHRAPGVYMSLSSPILGPSMTEISATQNSLDKQPSVVTVLGSPGPHLAAGSAGWDDKQKRNLPSKKQQPQNASDVERQTNMHGRRSDISPKQHGSKSVYSGSKNESESDLEIITVPERIVTVNASTNLETSDSSRDTTMEQPRYSGHILPTVRQGSKVISTATRRNPSDVYISKFSAEKSRVKETFLKRQQGPVKRVVQPRLINQVTEEKSANKTPSNNDAITAAVAASAAVAATQPFVQAQHDIETRMAQVLDKLSSLEKKPEENPKPATEDLTSQKMKELQKQLDQLTQQRLEYLEQMQRQQLQWQEKLMTMTKPVQPTSYQQTHFDSKYPINERYTQPDVGHAKFADHSRPHVQTPLDTPAPRRHRPMPTSRDGPSQHNTQKSSGKLLQEILHHGGYDDDGHMIQDTSLLSDKDTSLRPTSQNLRASRSYPVLSSDRHSSPQFRSPQQHKPVLKETDDNDTTQHKPAPLNGYLMKALDLPVSPYPSKRTDGSVSTVHYTEALQTLHRVQSAKAMLEYNLKSVTRTRDDIFTNPDKQQDQASKQKTHIRRMVDGYIDVLNVEVEQEILAAMEPPGTQQHVDVIEKPKVRGRYGKVSSKINSGLNKKEEQKGKLTEKRQKPKNIKIPFYEDERYMSRVYGKSYAAKRTTHREPYLRYHSTPSKPSSPTRKPVVVQEATVVRSAKTQTSPKPTVARTGQTNQYYFNPAHLPTFSTTGPAEGQLVHMAVPLRKPQIIASRNYVLPSPSTALLSNPKSTPEQPNVAYIEIESESKGVDRLSTKTLPNVDIDSEPATPARIELSPAPSSEDIDRLEGRDRPEDFDSYVAVKDIEGKSEDSESSIESSLGMELPGYRAAPTAYNGPVFPPRALENTYPYSDVLASDLKRRNNMENKAVEWIEQELMAKIISELHQEEKHMARRGSQISLTESDNSSLIAEAIGLDGMQLLVDAGQRVDNDVISELVREVLLEKISTAFDAVDHGRQDTVRHEEEYEKPLADIHHEVHTVPTPQPTPPPSRGRSPAISPAPTPVVTPVPSETHDDEPRYDLDAHLNSTILTAATTLYGTMKQVDETVLEEATEGHIEECHDVPTPQPTPPASPPPTPSVGDEEAILSPRSPTPKLRGPTPKLRSPTPRPSTEIPEVESPLSPQPWDDTSYPMSEENPHYDDKYVEIQEDRPMVMSVANFEQPDVLDEPACELSSVRMLKTPTAVPASEASLTPSSATGSHSMTTFLSETSNDSISEGQWLFSEGQINIRPIRAGPRPKDRNGSLSDNTLYGTEDLEQEVLDNTMSEGEVPVRKQLAKDPMLALLSKIQQPPADGGNIRNAVVKPQQRGRNDLRSIGEVSIGEVLFPRSATVDREETEKTESDPIVDSTLKVSDLSKDAAGSATKVLIVEPVQTTGVPSVRPRRQMRRPCSPGGKSLGMTSPKPMRRQQSAEEKPRASLIGGTGLLSAHTLSEGDARTFTPDQMNLDNLLQSGYLSQTFSQSEAGMTLSEQGTGNMIGQPQTGSDIMTQANGSARPTIPLRQTSAGPVKVSVTIPSFQESESDSVSIEAGYDSDSNISEIDISEH